jgi:hypothetical protein
VHAVIEDVMSPAAPPTFHATNNFIAHRGFSCLKRRSTNFHKLLIFFLSKPTTKSNNYFDRPSNRSYTCKMPAQQSAEFKKAAEESRKLKAKPTDDDLLQVRSKRFKVESAR